MHAKMLGEARNCLVLSWRMLRLLVIAGLISFRHVQAAEEEQQQEQLGAPLAACEHTWTGATECSWEPNLRAMTVQNFYGNQQQQQQQGGTETFETFYAYLTPDVSTFHNQTANSLQAKRPRFQGMFAKFINMSPGVISVYWRGAKKTDDKDDNPSSSSWSFVASVEPFGAAGVTSVIGHTLVATSFDDTVLTEWTMQEDTSLYYYDPFQFDLQKARAELATDLAPLYHMQWQNKIFAEQYKAFTKGHEWLSLYKQKTAPRFHMWRADALGQQHTVTTNEIHYVELPPASELKRGTSVYGPRPDERGRARRHRHRDPSLDLTLTVLSCAPRVFEIENFLSPTEIQHLLNLAQDNDNQVGGGGLQPSTSHFAYHDDTSTSSNHIRNAWISRRTDIVTDSIYRRAADVLQMDEALLRWRRKTEIPDFKESLISVSEPLQVNHYSEGQEYTPHVDFSIPGLVNMQPSRFATILFYLSDGGGGDEGGGGGGGGETIFPRWLNADTEEALVVKPVAGKAILYYNLLPDGNYDERSMQASLPVTRGEGWTANLWVWDPILDHTMAGHV